MKRLILKLLQRIGWIKPTQPDFEVKYYLLAENFKAVLRLHAINYTKEYAGKEWPNMDAKELYDYVYTNWMRNAGLMDGKNDKIG